MTQQKDASPQGALPQLTLFEAAPAPPPEQKPTRSQSSPSQAAAQPPATKPAPKRQRTPQAGRRQPAVQPAQAPTRAKQATAAAAGRNRPAGTGAVPAGDVRLTANIREDLHLKLKIAAAHRRTTIGELIEQLVEQYL